MNSSMNSGFQTLELSFANKVAKEMRAEISRFVLTKPNPKTSLFDEILCIHYLKLFIFIIIPTQVSFSFNSSCISALIPCGK